MKHIASLSYGAISLYMLELIYQKKLQLDEIVTCDIWATDTMRADWEQMVDFKKYVDKFILNRYGLIVNHIKAKVTYEEQFYTKRGFSKIGRPCKTENKGKIYGFPIQHGDWCVETLKTGILHKYIKNNYSYIGYSIEELERADNNRTNEIYPLIDFNKTRDMAINWCKNNNVYAPSYDFVDYGGNCWFCHNQSEKQLRYLYNNCPIKWELMLKWDKDSPVTFKASGKYKTIHDYDKLFKAENEQLISIFDLN
jgi:3'-phosphoadenosine 5'-phosphosulfate sulfotransferase (PAPS reductase)/FAD synthetase